MRLRRIEIRDFRRLAGRWVLDGLEDGLTVVGGDNEEGKSTLLAALKAALLEHHKVGGQVREAMAGHRGGTPAVALELELAGRRVRLDKEFGRRCELVVDGTRLVGDAAEDRLVELLRFTRRQGRAERRPEHQGLLALFWVDQGTSFLPEETLAALGAQRDRLHGAIAGEVGEVTGGTELRRLAERVEEQCRRFFTPSGAPRRGGELERARAEERAAEEEAARLEATRRAFDEAVDRLGRAREERDRLVRSDRPERARAARERAVEELARIERLEADRALARKELALADAEAARLAEEQAGRERRRAALAALEAELRRLEAEVATLAEERRLAERAALDAETAERRAVEAATRARRDALLAGEAAELVRAGEQVAALREAEETCRTLAARLAESHAALAELRVDEAGIAALREAARAVERQRAALEAVATTIEPHPEPGRTVSHDGAELAPGVAHRLVERGELRLPGWGRLVVEPGGGDLAARRRDLARTEAVLAAALAERGVATLAEAEAALLRRRAVEAEAGRAQERLQEVLRGLRARDPAALAEQLQVATRRLESRRAALGEGAEPAALAAALEERLEAQRAAEAALEAARRTAQDAAPAAGRVRERAAGLEGRRKELLARAVAEREALVGAEARLPDDRLGGGLEAARAEAARQRARLDDLARELERLDPDGVRARRQQAERAIAELAAERERLEQAVSRLEGEVRGLGAEACDARLDTLQARLAELRPARLAIEREAAAWWLLKGELAAADRAARDRLVEPVRRRLEPLLRRLLPEAAPRLDPASLAPSAILRDGIEEPLDTLSVGTREQLAVLVRLALGELLLEREGEAPCLILDDALVFADEARFERMKAILAKAAERQQILVLTCRPRDWLGLPGRRLRLEDCRDPVGSRVEAGGPAT